MPSKDAEKVKGTAFAICGIRTMMSFLPEEAEALCYDRRTPKFGGAALEFNPEPHGPMSTLEGTRKMAADYSAMVKLFDKQVGGEKNWDGLDFNFCQAHTVDALIVEAVADGLPIRQTVFCGVGQDYRGMRYGDAIHAQGIKVEHTLWTPLSSKQLYFMMSLGKHWSRFFHLISVSFMSRYGKRNSQVRVMSMWSCIAQQLRDLRVCQ
jgi:hypothetical protein